MSEKKNKKQSMNGRYFIRHEKIFKEKFEVIFRLHV
jgi:hypothetical protein